MKCSSLRTARDCFNDNLKGLAFSSIILLFTTKMNSVFVVAHFDWGSDSK